MQFFFRCTPANSGIYQSSTSSGATDTDTAVEAIFTPERRYCNFISDSDSEIECTHSLTNDDKSDACSSPDISDTHMDNNSSVHVTPPTAIPKPVREHSPTPLEAETTTPAERGRNSQRCVSHYPRRCVFAAKIVFFKFMANFVGGRYPIL